MKTTWIITANAGRARFFSESDPAEPLQELEDMVSTAARLRTADTETDKLGPTAASNSSHSIGSMQAAGFAHNANAGAPNKQYQPNQTPAEHDAEQFAREICNYLVKSHHEGRFDQLVISASPQFLGTLRTFIDPHLKDVIKLEFNKDYTQVNAPQLRDQLKAHQAKLQ